MADYSQMSIEELKQAFSQRASQIMGGSQMGQAELPSNAKVVIPPTNAEDVPMVETKRSMTGPTFALDPIQMKQKEKLLQQPLSETAIEKISDYDNSIMSTDNVIQMWNQNGGFETGPLKISNYSGQMGDWWRQAENDPAHAQFFAESEKMFQQFRKITTGAQASDRELRMLRPLIAKTTDRPQIFIAKALAAREVSRFLRDNYVKNQRKAGRSVSAFMDATTQEDAQFAKRAYENALFQAGVSDEEAQKLVDDTFARTESFVVGRSRDLGYGKSGGLIDDSIKNRAAQILAKRRGNKND